MPEWFDYYIKNATETQERDEALFRELTTKIECMRCGVATEKRDTFYLMNVPYCAYCVGFVAELRKGR